MVWWAVGKLKAKRREAAIIVRDTGMEVFGTSRTTSHPDQVQTRNARCKHTAKDKGMGL